MPEASSVSAHRGGWRLAVAEEGKAALSLKKKSRSIATLATWLYLYKASDVAARRRGHLDRCIFAGSQSDGNRACRVLTKIRRWKGNIEQLMRVDTRVGKHFDECMLKEGLERS
jgi:hypothetical protein